MLVDPNWGYPATADLLNPAAGLLLTLEDHRTTPDRRSSCIADWSVDKIRALGGDAVKLLAWYHPRASAAVRGVASPTGPSAGWSAVAAAREKPGAIGGPGPLPARAPFRSGARLVDRVEGERAGTHRPGPPSGRSRKKRTISAEASGPAASVWLPSGRPPDQA